MSRPSRITSAPIIFTQPTQRPPIPRSPTTGLTVTASLSCRRPGAGKARPGQIVNRWISIREGSSFAAGEQAHLSGAQVPVKHHRLAHGLVVDIYFQPPPDHDQELVGCLARLDRPMRDWTGVRTAVGIRLPDRRRDLPLPFSVHEHVDAMPLRSMMQVQPPAALRIAGNPALQLRRHILPPRSTAPGPNTSRPAPGRNTSRGRIQSACLLRRPPQSRWSDR